MNAVPRKRIILLLDVDCFYVQLWMNKLHPELIGQDVPVVVINSDEIILSVNYTAKSIGVKRGEDLSYAELRCLEVGQPLNKILEGERYGKGDTFLPQTESDLILDTIVNYVEMLNQCISVTVERYSQDEFYIDVTDLVDEGEGNDAYYADDPRDRITLDSDEIHHLTRLKNHPNYKYNGEPTTIMEGEEARIAGQEFSDRVLKDYPPIVEADHMDELRLVKGAIIANAIIEEVKRQTGYDLSAGVGHSKLVAKLACGRNKPEGITIMTAVSLTRLSESILFRDLQGYAGPDGERIEDMLLPEWVENALSLLGLLQCINFDYTNLIPVFKQLNSPNPVKRAVDLYNKCRFKDDSPVLSRWYGDTFSTGLSFLGFTGRLDLFRSRAWNLAKDMKSRINYNTRRGRETTELVVKAVMIQTCTASPSSFGNRITMQRGYLLSVDRVYYDLIWSYINQNKLNYYEIKSITLTAVKINVG